MPGEESMVAVPFDPQVTSASALDATLTMSQDRTETHELDATVTAVGWRGLLVRGASEISDGAHAWLTLPLPSGDRIRPLVRLSARPEGGATARFVHLFPADRQALEAYHASRSSSY
jgi:hypothetical protein